jgi:hypothetical protein
MIEGVLTCIFDLLRLAQKTKWKDADEIVRENAVKRLGVVSSQLFMLQPNQFLLGLLR